MADINIVSLSRTVRYSSSMAEELTRMKDEQIFVDFEIHVKKQCIPCHRLIIGVHSPVLRTMLLTDMVEASQRHVRLDHISFDIMTIIMDYMYCGAVSFHKEQLIETIAASDYLQILELKELCIAQAPSTIARNNVVSWWKLATKIGVADIKDQCKKFISTDYYKVSKQADFLGLDHAELQHYFEDIQDENIQGDDVLDAAMRWVNHDLDCRLEHLEDLLCRIRLDRCSVPYIKSVMKSYESVLDKEVQVYKQLSNALVCISARQILTETKPTTPKLLLAGGRNEEISRVCWKLEESKESEKLCDIPYRIRQHSVCRTPVGFAVTGGELCFMFVAALQSWCRMQNLMVRRTGHGSICIRNTMVIVGGWMEGNSCHCVEMMDINDGTWHPGPELPIPSRFPKTAQIDDEEGMYMLDDCTKELLHLDVKRKVWSRKAGLPVLDCIGCNMTSARGRLYMAGGKFRVFASYNPETDNWSLGAQPLLQHIYGSLVYHQHKLLLLGGSWRNGTDQVEEYDIEEGTWAMCTKYQMPASLYIHHCLVVDIPA